jgi:site-specific DNA-methyltransferase (adenine-specific)
MKAENGDRQMKNVWRFTAPGADEKTHGKHPTQKPLALIERCLRASTRPGDHVLDPFAGSGSTGVAAIGLGRRFTGWEVEKDYAGLAVKRLRAAEHAAMAAR